MKSITFCPSKRHYQPIDLVAAADKIRAIGLAIVKANISFKIFQDESSESVNAGKIFIELYDTDILKTRLFSIQFEAASGDLVLKQAPAGFNSTVNGNISLDQLRSFCAEYDTTDKAHCIATTISSLRNKDSGIYYVYRHIFKDGRMYIGKGKEGRANESKGRNSSYQRALAEMGTPNIEKLCLNMSEDSAYELECALIKNLREHHEYNWLLNRSGGMEQAKDVGDMPISTIQALIRVGKMHLDQTNKKETVNIFKRHQPEPGSAKEYYKNIGIYNAARLLGCTMNEVLRAEKQKNSVINGYSILSIEDFEEALKTP